MPETNDPAPLEVVAPDTVPPETEEQAKGRGKGKVSKDALAELVAMTPDRFAEHMKSGQRELWEILQYRLKKEANTLGTHQLVILYGILTDKINAPSSAVQQLHQHNHVTINGLSREQALKALGVVVKTQAKAVATGQSSKEPNYIKAPLRVLAPISEVQPISTAPGKPGRNAQSTDHQSPDSKQPNA